MVGALTVFCFCTAYWIPMVRNDPERRAVLRFTQQEQRRNKDANGH